MEEGLYMGLILFFFNQISLSQGFIVSSLVKFEQVVRKKNWKFQQFNDRQTNSQKTDKTWSENLMLLIISVQVSWKALRSAPSTWIEPGMGTPVADLRVLEKDTVSLDRSVHATEKHGDQERKQRNRFSSFDPQRENKRPVS